MRELIWSWIALSISLMPRGTGGAAAVSGASGLLAGETQGLAFDFTDDFYYATTSLYGSARVIDTGTPANNFSNDPYGLLTYTSPSAKMTMGPAGTLRFGAHNLCLQSETLTSGSWGKARITAPSADTIKEDATSGYHICTQSITIPAGSRVRFEAKAGGTNSFVLFTSGNQHVGVDVGSGAVGAVVGGAGYGTSMASTATIASVGDGWYAVTCLFTTAATSIEFYLFSAWTPGGTPTDVYAGSTSNGIQLRKVSVARTPSDDTYLATTSTARYALPFEWSPAGVLQGILVEEARTNLLANDISSTNSSSSSATITNNQAVDPSGEMRATKIVFAANGFAYWNNTATVALATYTGSMWLKADAPVNVGIRVCRSGTGTPQAVAVVALTTSWQRFSLTFTTDSGADAVSLGIDTRAGVTGDDGAAKTVYVRFGQVEAGSFATSVIPTLGSTVTRAADNISLATSAFPSSTILTAGSWFGTGDRVSGALYANVVGSNTAQYQPIRSEGSNSRMGVVLSAGIDLYLDLAAGSGNWQNARCAMSYNATTVDGVFNGSSVASDSGAITVAAVTAIQIGSQTTSAIFPLNGHVKTLMFVPRKMSSAELSALAA